MKGEKKGVIKSKSIEENGETAQCICEIIIESRSLKWKSDKKRGYMKISSEVIRLIKQFTLNLSWW